MQNTELSQYHCFYSKLRSCNPLEAEYTDYVILLKSGLTTEQAVLKFKLSKPPPTGIENYNIKDVVPTLEAMQKKLLFTTTKISIS